MAEEITRDDLERRIHEGLTGPFEANVRDYGRFSLGYFSVLKGNVDVGRDVTIKNGVYVISENSKVKIGNNVKIGDRNSIKADDDEPRNKGLDITIGDGTKTKVNVKIENDVVIGENNYIGNDCILGRRIRVGNDNRFNQGSNIAKNVSLGDRNVFYHCTVGSAPEGSERMRDAIQDTMVIIGNDNIFREYLVVNRGSSGEGIDGITKMGDRNLVLSKVQIAHDCKIGNANEIITESGIAGHVVIGNGVRVSGQAGVAQWVHIGDYAFIAGKSAVTGDVIPYTRVGGDPAVLKGINEGRLARIFKGDKAMIREAYSQLKDAYRIIKNETISDSQLVGALRVLDTKYSREMVDFIEKYGVERLLRKRH